MEQENNMSAGVPVASMPPAPPASPAPKQGNTLLIILLAVLLFVLLGSGYYLWSSGLLQGLMPAPAEVTPVQTETSDIEADLEGVDVGADAEVDALEAQI